jgi:hypothetical protein
VLHIGRGHTALTTTATWINGEREIGRGRELCASLSSNSTSTSTSAASASLTATGTRAGAPVRARVRLQLSISRVAEGRVLIQPSDHCRKS